MQLLSVLIALPSFVLPEIVTYPPAFWPQTHVTVQLSGAITGSYKFWVPELASFLHSAGGEALHGYEMGV